ncbi:hypothetical protein [Streptomyces sp. NPDC004685]
MTAITLTACGTQTEDGDRAKKPGKNSASPTASKDPSQQFLDLADNDGSGAPPPNWRRRFCASGLRLGDPVSGSSGIAP